MAMQMPAPSPRAERAFEAVAEELLETTPSERTKMMGMPSLKVNGKMFAGLWGDNLVFKLADPAHGEALSIRGARLFDPSGRSRPMKEWVAVPAGQSKRWPELARAAYDYAVSLTG